MSDEQRIISRSNGNNSYNFSDLKIEIELLKRDVSFIKTLFDKMDKVIDKIEGQHEVLFNKTSIIIEERMKSTKQEVSDLYNTIARTETSINERLISIERILQTEIGDVNMTLTDHIEKTDEFEERVNKYVYIGIGIVLLVGWIITNFDTVQKILK